MKRKYPLLQINKTVFRDNAKKVISHCNDNGVKVACVTKGFDSFPLLAQIALEEGAFQIATSRLEQVENMRLNGVTGPYLLIRVPSFDELVYVADLCEYSLESDYGTVKKLDEICIEKNKTHKVIMMADLGDLREGYWNKDEFVTDCVRIENEMNNIILRGIGVNLGCYGSIVPTTDKMNELIFLAEKIESIIGRKLEIISGGATSTYLLMMRGGLPERINHLRIGEAIEQPLALKTLWKREDMNELSDNVFTLKAQVIEVRNKPTHPVGQIFIDAFENTPVYEDRGIRKKALLCVGRADYGAGPEPVPVDKNISFVGASGDHTIIDIEDCDREIKVGDIVEFSLPYSSILYLSRDTEINMEYID